MRLARLETIALTEARQQRPVMPSVESFSSQQILKTAPIGSAMEINVRS